MLRGMRQQSIELKPPQADIFSVRMQIIFLWILPGLRYQGMVVQ